MTTRTVRSGQGDRLFRKSLGSILARWRASLLRLRLVWLLDGLIGRVNSLHSRRRGSGGVLVLATAGMGNTGDEAMLESCLANVPGQITVVVQSSNSFTPWRPDVATLVLPHLIDGPLYRRFPDVVRFARQLNRATELCVIGADVMDGVYYPPSAMARFSLLNLANRLGVRTRVLGFSWSDQAEPSAWEAIRRVAPSTRLFVRDPQSLRRLEERGVESAIAAADIVFALPHDSAAPARTKTVRAKLALLNVSGLIQSRMDQVPEFEQVLQHLGEAGWSLCFVPHVVRPGDDDLSTQRLLEAGVGLDSNVRFIDAKPSVHEVQKLVSQADLIITGRMHLAVLGIAAGVPAVVLGTQGKVAGLCELVGSGATEIEPKPGFGAEIIDAVRGMESVGLPELQANVRRVRPRLVELAGRNFDGMSG